MESCTSKLIVKSIPTTTTFPTITVTHPEKTALTVGGNGRDYRGMRQGEIICGNVLIPCDVFIGR
jgi:hypothetical protein